MTYIGCPALKITKFTREMWSVFGIYYEHITGLQYERTYALDDRMRTSFSVLEGFTVIRDELAKITATLTQRSSE